jgi:hypothetical protein
MTVTKVTISRRRWLQATSTLALAAASSPLLLGNTCTVRDSDRLWLISTRSLHASVPCVDLSAPDLSIQQQAIDGRWIASDVATLLAATDQRVLVNYIHGNRYNPQEAIQHGVEVYHRALDHSDAAPVDWVIWSWPSEQESIGVRDVRLKAQRTDAQSLYVAWLLQQVPSDRLQSLLGYSFGARICSGAAHVLAGGSLGGRTLDQRLPPPSSSLRMGLIAAAMDSDWLAPGRYHGRAGWSAERIAILTNSSDPVLRRYRWVQTTRGGIALGFAGLDGSPRRQDGSMVPVWQCDCSGLVGASHDENNYYRSRGTIDRVFREILWLST